MKKLALVMAVLMIFTCTSALADFHETNLPITDETYEFSMMIDDSGYPEDKIIYNMLEVEAFQEYVNLTDATVLKALEVLHSGTSFPVAPTDDTQILPVVSQ